MIDAFDRHDVNALAGLILWDGVAPGAANSRMRELAALIDDPSARIHPASGSDDPAFPDIDAQDGAIVIADDSMDSGELELDIVSIGSCRWLAW